MVMFLQGPLYCKSALSNTWAELWTLHIHNQAMTKRLDCMRTWWHTPAGKIVFPIRGNGLPEDWFVAVYKNAILHGFEWRLPMVLVRNELRCLKLSRTGETQGFADNFADAGIVGLIWSFSLSLRSQSFLAGYSGQIHIIASRNWLLIASEIKF